MKAKAKHQPPQPKNTFADTLLLGMCDAGFTDETLSAKIDYPPDTIYRWRTGKLNPSGRAKKAILQALTKKGRKA